MARRTRLRLDQRRGAYAAAMGAPSGVKSVARGTIVIASGAATGTATIPVVDPTNSEVAWLGNYPDGNEEPINAYARVALINGTTVTATRNNADPGSDPLNVGWEVLQRIPGELKSVTRGTILVTGTLALPGVNPARCRTALLGYTSVEVTSSGAANRQLPRVELTNGTTATGTAGAANATAGVQVTEHN